MVAEQTLSNTGGAGNFRSLIEDCRRKYLQLEEAVIVSGSCGREPYNWVTE
jgi:hypothetical protein